jgi:hypothetical protein
MDFLISLQFLLIVVGSLIGNHMTVNVSPANVTQFELIGPSANSDSVMPRDMDHGAQFGIVSSPVMAETPLLPLKTFSLSKRRFHVNFRNARRRR